MYSRPIDLRNFSPLPVKDSSECNDLESVLIPHNQIMFRVRTLRDEISASYSGGSVYVLTLLKGAKRFYEDIFSEDVGFSYQPLFRKASSYVGTESSGEVKFDLGDLPDMEGERVLIIEDIVDTGLTLSKVRSLLMERGAREVRICTLLDKPSRRKVKVDLDFVGFTIPDEFVVGYGLDYNDKYRDLDNIGILKPAVYEN